MKAARMTGEQAHALGARPDGKGGVVRLPAAEWDSKHGRTYSEPVAQKPAIRIPRARIPNATESRYGDILRVRHQDCDVIYEGLTFRLRSGTAYTPDWIVMQGATIIAAWEVKGAWLGRSGRSILAWKTAANEWPAILWGFAQWRDRAWLEQEILPRVRPE